jgi:hypothetical protein
MECEGKAFIEKMEAFFVSVFLALSQSFFIISAIYIIYHGDFWIFQQG